MYNGVEVHQWSVIQACSRSSISYRNALTDWYVELQLKSYRALFRPGFEVCAIILENVYGNMASDHGYQVSDLDNISRRYAWLKRMLNTCEEEQGSIFPPEWRISEKLCHRFCKYTRYPIAKRSTANDGNT
jgi:hypothetical protein